MFVLNVPPTGTDFAAHHALTASYMPYLSQVAKGIRTHLLTNEHCSALTTLDTDGVKTVLDYAAQYGLKVFLAADMIGDLNSVQQKAYYGGNAWTVWKRPPAALNAPLTDAWLLLYDWIDYYWVSVLGQSREDLIWLMGHEMAVGGSNGPGTAELEPTYTGVIDANSDWDTWGAAYFDPALAVDTDVQGWHDFAEYFYPRVLKEIHPQYEVVHPGLTNETTASRAVELSTIHPSDYSWWRDARWSVHGRMESSLYIGDITRPQAMDAVLDMETKAIATIDDLLALGPGYEALIMEWGYKAANVSANFGRNGSYLTLAKLYQRTMARLTHLGLDHAAFAVHAWDADTDPWGLIDQNGAERLSLVPLLRLGGYTSDLTLSNEAFAGATGETIAGL